MKRNTRNAGFTLIELMIVVAIIAIIAAIAIPKLMSARISANENAAVSTLRSIASAQHQLESSVAVDTDADGGGEFGFFGELAGMVAMRIYDAAADAPALGAAPDDVLDPPILPTGFGDVIADTPGDGIVERQGYHFKMWLPDVTAGGVTPAVSELNTGGADGGNLPDPDNAEILWACYAWPVDAEKTGNRCFFINQEGDLLQFDNRDESYEMLNGPAFDAAFADDTGGGDMSTSLGITAMGFTANDGNTWTVVGN
ncbi:MAG: prepilin-type N-terminal cleavage/methylation domain-containing protein [Planctomycetota bacterium]